MTTTITTHEEKPKSPTTMEGLRAFILEEAGRCIYCGFCEAVCPTLPLGPHRGYGPRGRVNLALQLAKGSQPSRATVESLYTCLLCAACHTKCPAQINIAGVVRAARVLTFRRK